MEDFRTRRERLKGYWLEEKASVPCIVTADGLLVIFRFKDVVNHLKMVYPHTMRNGQIVWHFNGSKDREVAEQDGDRVYANPRVLWEQFMKKE